MEDLKPKINFDFVNRTLKFCAVGIFIPGFTAILLIGIQLALTKLDLECSNAWNLLWTITWIGMILNPVIFIRHLANGKDHERNSLGGKLILFNLLEYIFIQASLGSLISNSERLCYETDGQNGLELAFTAWLSLPILIIFSFVFKNVWLRKE